MRPSADSFEGALADASVRLTRQDIINLERSIKDAVRAFAPFSGYSLYFPRAEGPAPELRYDGARRELVLPLVLGGETLAVFVARGVTLTAPKAVPPLLRQLATSVLEKLLLYKRSVTDRLTGLMNHGSFSEALARQITIIRECLTATSGGRSDTDLECFSASLGVILLDIDFFQWINERYGYALGDRAVAAVGRAIAEICPRTVSAARLHNDTFALLAPDASPKACLKLAESVRRAVAALSFADEVTDDRIRLSASLGYANYPQSLRGPQLRRTPREQAHMLLRAAAKAVGTSKDHGRNRVFGFQDILKNGGRVLEVLPMRRIAVSLGRGVGAQEGQRFLIWSPRPRECAAEARLPGEERLAGRAPELYKGELALTEVQADIAFAELVHAGDPSRAPEPGDRLSLIQERAGLFAVADGEAAGRPRRDMLTGLYGYRDFLTYFGRARRRAERFGLALLRVLPRPAEGPERREGAVKRLDAAVTRTAALAERLFPAEDPADAGKEPGAAGGRFGLGGLAYFLPGAAGEPLRERARLLAERAASELDLELAIGVYAHPFLSFARTDAIECARKALDHALLLPAPRVALFDSVSLNVSADRLFAEGDLYAAVEEFKLALLADETNLLARNSLGICYARLGKADLARREFEQVTAAEPNNVMAHYNLGWACQRLGEEDAARAAYERCLALDPGHAFSLLRLGSMAERAGDLIEAEKLYAKALATPGGEQAAHRPLARLYLALGERDRAREHLHLALAANHNDAFALHMLARLYLDAGEDPQIAEALARQAAALMPERQEFWDALVLALKRQGREAEAARAAARGRG